MQVEVILTGQEVNIDQPVRETIERTEELQVFRCSSKHPQPQFAEFHIPRHVVKVRIHKTSMTRFRELHLPFCQYCTVKTTYACGIATSVGSRLVLKKKSENFSSYHLLDQLQALGCLCVFWLVALESKQHNLSITYRQLHHGC